MNAIQPLIFIRSAWRDWANTDAPVLSHAIKVLIAGIMALWISLLFDLDQPRTALITVTIVMQTHSGMVLAKSYYRLVGTIAGILVSLFLVAFFAQERVMFLISMAAWIGMCTAGAVILRDHQSYAFVLAGYTLCIVGLPATLHPDNAFGIAMSRISEIVIGLTSATVVSDLVFPKRIGGVMLASVRTRFMDFSALLASAFSGNDKYRIALARLMSDIFRLESFRASSALESDQSRSLRLKLGRLNMDFMEVSTTFHAVDEHFRRLEKRGLKPTVDALKSIYNQFLKAAIFEERAAQNEKEAEVVGSQLKAFIARFDEIAADSKATDIDRFEYDVGVELLRRLADELRVYAITYASLSKTSQTVEAPALGIHFDPVTAVLAGARGALMLGIMATVWIATEWESGIEAITIGVVSSTLFATSPLPSRTIRQFLLGALIGAVLAYWVSFHLLPEAQGFWMLVLAISPGIAFAASLTGKPDKAVIGAGIFIVYLTHLGFGRIYEQNPQSFMNDVMADFLGILCSALLYELIDLEGSRWSQQRTIASLRKLVVEVCLDAKPLKREKLEIGARDLVYRSGSLRRITGPGDRMVIDWLLLCLEVGHTIIAMREKLVDCKAPGLKTHLLDAMEKMAVLFDAPSKDARDDAMRTLEVLGSYLAQESQVQRTRIDLQLLKNALMDEESVLISSTKR